jgi:hypothetical protein
MKNIITLKKQFVMTAQEMADYNNLPDNLPENRLTEKQKNIVSGLYYKYIRNNIDNQDWSEAMFRSEQHEKWPSGPRVKDHEAKRFILSWLVELNMSCKKMTMRQAAIKFYGSLSLRAAYGKLVSKVYEVPYK